MYELVVLVSAWLFSVPGVLIFFQRLVVALRHVPDKFTQDYYSSGLGIVVEFSFPTALIFAGSVLFGLHFLLCSLHIHNKTLRSCDRTLVHIRDLLTPHS